ncbi:Hypothetical predicted protein, partial [Mytilus galloprovincialis]
MCVEKDTMWSAIAAGGAGSPGKGSKIKKELEQIQKQNEELKSTVTDLQCESLKQNLVFYGVVDQPGENTDSLLKGFIRSEINIKSEIKFVNVRRINSKFNPRPILASFESLKDREKVRRSAYRLKGTPFSLSEQYPSDILAKRKRLIPILKEARSQNVKAVLLKDKLYIDNDVFDPLKHKQFIKESTVAFPSGASSGNSKAKSTVGSNDDDPDPNSNSIVWLNIKQGILTKDKSVYIACIYIPPVKSKYYKLYDCDLYNELENSIELYSELGHVFILGDLNGRTGTLVDFLENDDIHFTLKNRICGAFEYLADSVLPKRVNPDLNTNSYGSKIISMCKSSGLRIVNGRHKNGFSNDFTYCGPIGMSVLDYFIVPSFYFPNINQLIVSNFTTYSDHAFLHLELNLLIDTMRNTGKCSDAMEDTERRVKYKWKDEFKEQCTECIRINMDNIIRLQNRINFENQNSFDKSLSNFTCMIEDIMSPFFKTMPYVNNKPYKPVNYFDKPWFNTRCKELYRCYIDYLHVFNRSKSIVNHTNLTCAKREYKVMERRLKREYQRIEGNAMDFLKYSNPKLFYSKFRKRTEKKNNVPLQSFYEHFKKLSSVNIDNTCDEDLFNNTDGDCVYPELDEVITEEEILKAIRNLKRNKSHGVDGILNEYFIEYKDVFMPILVKVFNGILQS